MTKKKRKKRFDSLLGFSRHPRSLFGHLILVRLTIALLALTCGLGAAFAVKTVRAQNSGASHAHDFIIFATVLNDRGFALFGAQARVRRAGEKKFRWEAFSDHQGELAIRVPPNTEYELTIEARGFPSQTRKIDAKADNRADLTIRMELPDGGSDGKSKGSGGKS